MSSTDSFSFRQRSSFRMNRKRRWEGVDKSWGLINDIRTLGLSKNEDILITESSCCCFLFHPVSSNLVTSPKTFLGLRKQWYFFYEVKKQLNHLLWMNKWFWNVSQFLLSCWRDHLLLFRFLGLVEVRIPLRRDSSPTEYQFHHLILEKGFKATHKHCTLSSEN